MPVVLVVGSLALVAPTAEADDPLTEGFVALPDFGGGSTIPRGMSASGLVAGYSANADGWMQPFRWQPGDGALTPLELPADADPNANNEAVDVSGSGWIAGHYQQADGGSSRAVVWAPGSDDPIPIGPAGVLTSAVAVNENGWVTGQQALPDPDYEQYLDGYGVFVWSLDDGYTLLGPGAPSSINSSGWVVGVQSPAPDGFPRAFVWRPGDSAMTPLLPAGFDASSAVGIADDGTIVGVGERFEPVVRRPVAWLGQPPSLPGDPVVYEDSPSLPSASSASGVAVGNVNLTNPLSTQGYRWESGDPSITLLSGVGTNRSTVFAVSPNGWISGLAFDTLDERRLVRWAPGETDPADLRPAATAGGLFVPSRINDSGWMVGNSPDGAFFWGPSPEVDDNGDGIPDDEQVGSVVTGGGDLVVHAPFGTSLTDLSVTSPPTSPPGGIQAQTDLISFAVEGTIGTDLGTVDIVLTLPADLVADAYWKLLAGSWVDATSVASFSVPGEVTLSLADNGSFDTDTRLGAVADPGMLALDRRYTFIGLGAPFITGSTSAKPGSTVPLKWRVLDHEGAPINSVSHFVSLRFAPGCPQSGSATSDRPKPQGDGYWTLSWKTAKQWRGTCTVVLALGDGSSRAFIVRFI